MDIEKYVAQANINTMDEDSLIHHMKAAYNQALEDVKYEVMQGYNKEYTMKLIDNLKKP